MKKKTKKLVLSKETVCKLQDGQLLEAAGGTTFWPSCYTWPCGSYAAHCFTETDAGAGGATGGTNP
jgi:hypothetical protein